MKFNRITIFIVVAIILLAVFIANKHRFVSLSSPNILLITLDTTRADHLGCYGCTYAVTPTLDRLAKEGALFEKCRTVTPLTLPSHTSILTGLYPPEHGLHVNGAGRLNSGIVTLADVFKINKYDTSAFISSLVLDSKYGLDSGFDVYSDDIVLSAENLVKQVPGWSLVPESHTGDITTDRAIKWLESHVEKPFFCWVHLYDPHYPYIVHSDVVGAEFENNYDAEIAFADVQVGRLLSVLQDHGIMKRTIIIVVADHGEGLLDHNEQTHGVMIYDSTMRVPFIISGPGIKKGLKISETVNVIDLFPTLLKEYAPEYKLPYSLRGKDIRSFLRGHAETDNNRLHYGETESPLDRYGWAPLKYIATDKWKYIYSPLEELYDLVNDPHENNNLAQTDLNRAGEMKYLLKGEYLSMKTIAVPDVVQITGAEKRALESLGYTAGGNKESLKLQQNSGELPSFGERPDIKLMIDLLNEDFSLTHLLQEQKIDDDAIKRCRALVDKSPKTDRFYGLLAEALRMQGKLDEAEECYRESLNNASKDPKTYAGLGDILLRKSKYKEAKDMLLKSVAGDQMDHLSLTSLGFACTKMGDLEEAERYYIASLTVNPDVPLTHLHLADLYVQSGNFGKAQDHYKSALNLNPAYGIAEKRLAWLLATCPDDNVRDPAKALPYAWNICEKTEHKVPEHLDILAAAYAAKGKYDKAVETAETAINLLESETNTELFRAIQSRLNLYKDGKAYIEKTGKKSQDSL